MDIYEVLKNDHERILQLIMQLKTGDDTTERGRLFELLSITLDEHAQGEEELFYPIVGEEDANDTVVASAEEEHDQMDQLVADLEEIGTRDRRFIERLEDLESVFRAHIDVEEHLLFDLARRELDEADAQRLGREMIEAEPDLPHHTPPPAGPLSAL